MQYISQVWPHDAAIRVAGAMDVDAFAAHWSDRSCGLACVAMLVEHLRGIRPAFDELWRDAMAIDGYCSAGWRHAALARLLAMRGIDAQATPISGDIAISSLREGQLFIASVGNGFPLNPARRGGHLVVLHRCLGLGASLHFGVKDPAGFGRFRNTIRTERVLASLGASAIRIIPQNSLP